MTQFMNCLKSIFPACDPVYFCYGCLNEQFCFYFTLTMYKHWWITVKVRTSIKIRIPSTKRMFACMNVVVVMYVAISYKMYIIQISSMLCFFKFDIIKHNLTNTICLVQYKSSPADTGKGSWDIYTFRLISGTDIFQLALIYVRASQTIAHVPKITDTLVAGRRRVTQAMRMAGGVALGTG